MKTIWLTKIVPVCLLMALCACTNKERPEPRTRGVGTQSKLGQTLAQGTWCKPSQISPEGIVQIEKLVFSTNGDVQKTNYVLLSDNTLSPQAQADGTWSIIDTSLVLMEPGQKTVNLMLTKSLREADGANCLNLTPSDENGVTEQICPCN